MAAGSMAALGVLAAILLAAAPASAQYSTKTLYVLRCAGCHGVDGVGSASAGVPAFPGYVGAFARDEEGRVYMTHVPGVVGSGLSNGEIAAVLNYIVDTWSGEPPGTLDAFTEEEVQRLRAEVIPDVVGYRRDVVRRLAAEGVSVADYPWP